MARFIFFIDVLYENKNILSLSSEMELDKVKLKILILLILKEQFLDSKK